MRRRHHDEEEDQRQYPEGAASVLPLIAPQTRRSKRRKKAAKSKLTYFIYQCVFWLSGVAFFVLFVHEATHYVLLNRLDLGFPPSAVSIRDAVDPARASMAIVSLHRGFKFSGYLGGWLARQKRNYANFRGYAYFDQRDFPSENELHSLSPWQRAYHRRLKFDKLRYLLFLMETRANLEWLLWLDADATVTDARISMERRIREFGTKKAKGESFCVAWAEDGRPNTGVLLLRNAPVTRQLLRASLSTFSEKQTFIDQASFTAAVAANATYSNCQLLLEGPDATLIQSRVRGRPSITWKPGDWILHLPNHNRLEMLRSLTGWLPKKSLRNNPRPCRDMPPVSPPNLFALSNTRRERFRAVQGAIRHAWKCYEKEVLRAANGRMPHDDLMPLRHTGTTWLHYAATLHDALDTLYLANLTKEYDRAVGLVTSFDVQTTALRVTKTFEYSLRVVGGLLGAYSVSGDTKLLEAARNAADALITGPFSASPTALPRSFDLLVPPMPTDSFSWESWKGSAYRLVGRIYRWGRDAFTQEHVANSLAAVGSFALEFSYLSGVTRDPGYRRASNAIFDVVKTAAGDDGTIPTDWNVMTGKPLGPSGNGTLGSGADSFYEYLLKVPILNGCTRTKDERDAAMSCSPTELEMWSLYRTMVRQSLCQRHVKKMQLELETQGVDSDKGNSSWSFPVDDSLYYHLLAFLPGLLALGASLGEHDHDKDVMKLAMDLFEGCWATYHTTLTGLGPELGTFQKGQIQLEDPSYLLRPEFVETVFILYRLTKDNRFQDIGWKVFQSLEHYCKVPGGGYAGLQDVRDPSQRVDSMPSYFLAETLKYLLLLFGPDNFVSLDEFVFTTEAHPLRKLYQRKGPLSNAMPLCVSGKKLPIPIPWSLIACLLALVTLLVALMARTILKKCGKKKKSY